MLPNQNSEALGNPNIDEAETAGSALGQEGFNLSNAGFKSSVTLVIEREKSFEEEEEETSGKVESWGVYLQSEKKTLIGLFWDKELASFFKDSIQNSPLLDNLKKLDEENNTNT